jgi:hypothetical protein
VDLKDPIVVYAAAGNLEAQMIADMLNAKGIAAFAEEDQSGVSLWACGTISQFHKPRIYVEKAASEAAARIIADFEEQKWQRQYPSDGEGRFEVVCEECGKQTTFPASLNGTTQNCSHCQAFVDVGEFAWDDDLGEADG